MNSFGRVFKISIFGESHGNCVGVTIDGCPAGIPLCVEDFDEDLKRRQSGALGTTPRKEPDLPKLISGVFNKRTTAAPLTILFENTNTQSKDYTLLAAQPRPGHADFVAWKKYGGFNDYTGGGHFSGRLTLALVAAGVVAKKILNEIRIHAELIEAGGQTNVQEAVLKAIEEHDSIGGVVECKTTGIPIGLGEPFFDSVESVLSHMVFSIPAIKGIEFGSGFQAAKMLGSEHNDNILNDRGETETNNAGGINGGISNGNELVFRVAVKPTSSIEKPQKTLNIKNGKQEELRIEGRHDRCIAIRVPPVIEAATAIVLADFMLIEQNVKRVFEE
ncbi:MAG: chorismate synthase [Bacteroidales bacterium]|nr:chorismate synthase [Bacteroidales bacterium]